MENITNEFSFVLKPSKYGVGVFAVHGIAKGTPLRLFGDEGELDEKGLPKRNDVVRKKNEVPKQFHDFCVDRGDELICPVDFGRMQIGWYMNHSSTPNAQHHDYDYYATRDIQADEEIVIDYNLLEEPTEARDEYYKE